MLSRCLARMSRLQEPRVWEIDSGVDGHSSLGELAHGLVAVGPHITTLALEVSPKSLNPSPDFFSALFPRSVSTSGPQFRLSSLHLENFYLPARTFSTLVPDDLQSLSLPECTLGFTELPPLPNKRELALAIDFNDHVSFKSHATMISRAYWHRIAWKDSCM